MKRSSLFGLVGFAAISCAATALVVLAPGRASSSVVEPTPVPTSTPLFPTRDLVELDRSVQAYFAVVPRDGNFGYSRIPTFGPVHASYHPAAKEDQAIVSKLRGAGQEVVFFLVGREHFAGRMTGTLRTKGPLVITSRFYNGSVRTAKDISQAGKETNAIAKSAPPFQQVTRIADAVFAQPKPDEGARKQVGDWKVIACPVEASSPECVTCHNNMAKSAAKKPGSQSIEPDLVSLHDPLGIALYCVHTSPQIQTGAQSSSRP